MKIKIDRMTEDGATFAEEVDVDLRIDNLTMREAVSVEALLGEEKFNRMLDGETRSPAIIQAVLYAKLKSLIPDLEFDAFDVDLSSLNVEGDGGNS